MNSTDNGIDFQSNSGKDIFIGTNKAWLYSDTCMPAPLFDIPQWLLELVA